MNIQKAPEQARIDNKTTAFEAQISAYGTLKSSLSSLQTILTPLTDPDIFNAKALNVPSTDVITTNSLSAEAQAGNYQIEVTQVAKTQSLAINIAATEADSALGKVGQLTFKFGEWDYSGAADFTLNADKATFSIDVVTDDSLDDIAEKINDANVGVQAAVLEIDGNFQLLITAESGAKNAIEITTDDQVELGDFEYNEASILAGSTTVVETQQGQDAELELNGLEITRESNNITDVIKGLDFTLNEADIGNPISFSITEDKSAAETAIRDFITAYNLFFETASSLTGVSTDEDNNVVTGDLAKDGTAKNILSRIRQIISGSAQGLEVSDEFSALTHVGIRTKRDGSLEIIEEEFSSALTNNFDKISHLFATATETSSSYLELNVGSYAGDAIAGIYDIEITQSPTKGEITGGAVALTLDLATGTHTFKINVDGVESDEITLNSDFASTEELAAEMQALINGDENLKDQNAKVDVTVVGGVLKFVSRAFGSSSKVEFTDVSTDFEAKSGLSTSLSGSTGVNAEGTIGGVVAFGSGNILLPAIGTEAYGLNI
ncbi:MAG: flagellar filament capping protein FliD, partial [Pseudomonadales bacterium]|nr:flagellar filament capping protein FliD [Pseudomonadales bacterium]